MKFDMVFNVCEFHSVSGLQGLSRLLLQFSEEFLELSLHNPSPSVGFDSGQCTFQFGSFLDYSLVFLVILSSFFVTVVYHYL